METLLLERIVDKLKTLPQPSLLEILKYVDYLSERNLEADKLTRSEEPLLSIAGILSGNPLDSEAIDEELYGA
jgi:hypothetical protein